MKHSSSSGETLRVLRLFDRQESLCAHLRDSFTDLPDTQVMHCELNFAIQGADCLVLPIHTYLLETPILKSIQQLLGDEVTRQIYQQYEQTYDNELIPNQTCVIHFEPRTAVSETLRTIITVAVWTKPFLGPEGAIEHAFHSVLNTIHVSSPSMPVVAVPTFFTSTVSNVLSPKISADQLARVYWRYLKAINTPELSDTWFPMKDPLLTALQRGPDYIRARGMTGDSELVRLLNIAVRIEATNPQIHRAAVKMLNYLLRRDESKLPPHGIWTRSFVLARIIEIVNSNPQMFDDLLQQASIGAFKPYARLDLSTVTKGDMIGRGAGGLVWKVTQNGVPFAMKQMHLFGEESLAEVRREVSLLVFCSHHRIISCHAAVLKKDEFCYMMDLGRCDLRGLLDKKQLNNDTQRKRIALQLAEGIAYIHKSKLIHRDLKSPNVIIMQSSGPYYDIKIADLGICRPVNKMMTKHAGTPIWSAPEVGRGVYTEKADIYSYGILLWEMMTSDVPFGSVSDFGLWDKVVKGLRPQVPKQYNNLPIVKLMTACWQDKPEKRPSAEEIVSVLGRDIQVPEMRL